MSLGATLQSSSLAGVRYAASGIHVPRCAGMGSDHPGLTESIAFASLALVASERLAVHAPCVDFALS